MLIPLAALLVALGSIVRSRADLELENLDVRHQLGVLRRSARKRLKLTARDRFFWFVSPACGGIGARRW
jgi:hypothetical protein